MCDSWEFLHGLLDKLIWELNSKVKDEIELDEDKCITKNIPFALKGSLASLFSH